MRLVVVIPLAGAGMIVGKEDKTIKGINDKTGAFAVLAKAPLESDPARKELIVTGTRAQVLPYPPLLSLSLSPPPPLHSCVVALPRSSYGRVA